MTEENAAILNTLVRLRNLTPEERQFIREVTTHKNLTKRQQETLLYLGEKYLKEGKAG
jgi:hypothetical protein